MNPQKETEKALKREGKAKRAKAPYAERMAARSRRIEKQQKREDFWYGIGSEWRCQLAVRQLCRLLYRSIRSDYLKQLRLNVTRGFTVQSEWTVSLFTQYYDDETPPSNRFGIHCFPTGFYKREKAKAGRAINRIEHFQKLKTTEASNPLLSDIAEVFNRKYGKTFRVSYEEGECVRIVLEGPHPVTKI